MENPYLRALEAIAEHNGFTCIAISRYSQTAEKLYQVSAYSAIFKPDNVPSCRMAWLGWAIEQGLLDEEDFHAWRLTALAFASAMLEAGDLDDELAAARLQEEQNA